MPIDSNTVTPLVVAGSIHDSTVAEANGMKAATCMKRQTKNGELETEEDSIKKKELSANQALLRLLRKYAYRIHTDSKSGCFQMASTFHQVMKTSLGNPEHLPEPWKKTYLGMFTEQTYQNDMSIYATSGLIRKAEREPDRYAMEVRWMTLQRGGSVRVLARPVIVLAHEGEDDLVDAPNSSDEDITPPQPVQKTSSSQKKKRKLPTESTPNNGKDEEVRVSSTQKKAKKQMVQTPDPQNTPAHTESKMMTSFLDFCG